MRKVFLFLATAALFASCSDDLLEPNNGFQAQDLSSKGITFQVVKDDPATRGMFEKIEGTNSYTSFFFAEQDKVNIWAANAIFRATRLYEWTNATDGALNAQKWSDTDQDKEIDDGELVATSNKAIYKATKSQADPFLTAIDKDNLLNLVDYDADTKKATTGKFFAAYPVDQTVSYVAANGTGADAVPEHFKITAIDLSNQNYNGYMNMDKRLMYAYAEASKKDNTTKEQNKSVGESVALTFKSPLSTILFKCEDVEAYSTILGNLKSITITSQYSPLLPNSTTNKSYAVQDKDKVKASDDKFYLYGDVVPDEYTEVARADVNTPKVMVPSKFKKANDKVKVAPENVSITPDVFTYDVNHDVAWVSNSKSVYTRTAKLTVGDGTTGLKISNKDEMNLFVLPVKHETGKGENYTISYQFANVTLTYNWPTYASFNENTGATRFTFNIANNFKYIVTNDGASGRNLIVNDVEFSKIFGTGDNANNVSWAGDYINPSEFTSILINEKVAALTESDFEKLRNFTNVTSLRILNGTQVLYPLKAKDNSGAYQGMTSLTTLEANVTTVNANALPASIVNLTLKSAITIAAQDETLVSLATLILPKYQFSNGVHPSVFFTTTEGKNETLRYLDLSSVETLCPAPGQTTSISFKGYEALDSVKLNSNSNGVKLYSYQFSGCKNLQKVTGLLDITNAKYAFEGCEWTKKDNNGKVVGTFDKVRINGTVIPEGAFKGSTVKTIYYGQTGNTQVVPTSIGKDAFSGNKAIEAMDLSTATTIGTGAFSGATSFVGMPDKNHYNAVVLIVEAVAENAFKDTNIASFFLQNATSTGANSLASSAVDQIMYAADLDEDYDEEEGSPISVTQVAGAKKKSVQIFVSNDGDKDLFGDYDNVRKYVFTK